MTFLVKTCHRAPKPSRQPNNPLETNGYQVADDQPIRRSSVLVHHDEVGDPVGPAGRQQLLKLVVAAVESLRVRNNKAKFLKMFNTRFNWHEGSIRQVKVCPTVSCVGKVQFIFINKGLCELI